MRRHRRSITDSSKYHPQAGPIPETTPETTRPRKPSTTSPTSGGWNPRAWSLFQALLFTISLVAVVAGIGRYELAAGVHAGWGVAAWVVPFAVGPYVLWTWTDPTVHLADELFAVVLLAASVTLSVAAPPPQWQALGIGLVLIATEWRMVVRWRARHERADQLSAATDDLEQARQQVADKDRHVADLTRQLAEAEEAGMADVAALQDQLEAAHARLEAATASPPPAAVPAAPATVLEDAPPWGRTFAAQVEYLRERLAAGERLTGEIVQARMGLGSAKAGRDRLAAARKLRSVGKAV